MTPSSRYLTEPVDRLPFGSKEKADRYRTERYLGATGLNWYTADPTLGFMMRYHLTPEQMAWAEPRLTALGEVVGGRVSERAEETDRHPPHLVRYDRWGHDVSEVVVPRSAQDTKADLYEHGFFRPEVRRDAQAAGVTLKPLDSAFAYLLNQAEIGMMCAIGTGGDMVTRLVEQYAPADVRDHVLARFASGEWWGSTAQLLTERTGGTDLAQIETTATPAGDAWLLNGFKWFASNADGEAWVVLAKPEGAPDGIRGISTFLVLKHRRDGSRNGIRIRQLKDKLGTKAVASAEVELVDAEAFLLAPSGEGGGGGREASEDGGPSNRGLTRMMEMTNGARLGIAMMGLGCARRSLVESLCYATAREASGRRLVDQPLMRRKLAEMVVDVEAAQALVFDGYGNVNHQRDEGGHRMLRIGAPLVKLRAARLGITAASDAVEVHGGNGYVETWPVARILRDAQVNTIWEGADNVLCLDVRRGIERESADVAFVERVREAVGHGDPADPTTDLVARRVDDVADAVVAWKGLDREVGEARLFALSQLMVDVYAGALLVEQAAWEAREEGADRKALVARLYARRVLGDAGRLRGVDDLTDEALSRFDDLVSGALVDDRPRD